MKIFLGNPPWILKNRRGVRAGSRWPFTTKVKKGSRLPAYVPFPFLLAYSAAVLEKDGFDVLLIDAIAEGLNEEDFLKKINDYRPDVILLETSTPSINNDLNIGERIKSMVSAKLVLSGPHASVFKEEILSKFSFIDYILEGEYEYTLLELIKSLQQNQPLDNIPGLSYRAKEREIKVNARRPIIADLDKLPWPARHFLPMRSYNDAFCGLPVPSLQMWTSRGCPYRCIFCLWPDIIYGGHSYRMRNPVDIVNELEDCIRNYGFKSVYFDDDTFNVKRDHVLAVSNEIKKRNLNIVWAAMCRADIIDSEMLKAMKDSGLYAVKYGVESGSQSVLDNCGKNLKLDIVRKNVELTKSFGIKVHLTFTFGLPGETKNTIEETLKFAWELCPDSLQFSLTTPFPGTEYFRLAEDRGLLLTQDWSKYDGAGTSVIKTEKLESKELEKALLKANKMWSRRLFIKDFSCKRRQYLTKAFFHPIKAITKLSELLY